MKLYARRGFEWAEDGLVGLWSPVSTGRTDSLLLDSLRSNDNPGSTVNYTSINDAWAGSTIGSVLNFPTSYSNRYFLCSNQQSFPNTLKFSLSVWVNLSSTGTTQGLLSFGSNAYELSWTASAVAFGIPGNSFASGSFAQVANTWTNITATINANSTSQAGMSAIYVNGNPLSLTNNAAPISALTIGSNTIIGMRNTSLAWPFYGRWAEGCVFRRSLMPGEVMQYFQAGPGTNGMWQDRPRRSRVYFSSAGFRAYWHRRQSQLIGGGLK